MTSVAYANRFEVLFNDDDEDEQNNQQWGMMKEKETTTPTPIVVSGPTPLTIGFRFNDVKSVYVHSFWTKWKHIPSLVVLASLHTGLNTCSRAGSTSTSTTTRGLLKRKPSTWTCPFPLCGQENPLSKSICTQCLVSYHGSQSDRIVYTCTGRKCTQHKRKLTFDTPEALMSHLETREYFKFEKCTKCSDVVWDKRMVSHHRQEHPDISTLEPLSQHQPQQPQHQHHHHHHQQQQQQPQQQPQQQLQQQPQHQQQPQQHHHHQQQQNRDPKLQSPKSGTKFNSTPKTPTISSPTSTAPTPTSTTLLKVVLSKRPPPQPTLVTALRYAHIKTAKGEKSFVSTLPHYSNTKRANSKRHSNAPHSVTQLHTTQPKTDSQAQKHEDMKWPPLVTSPYKTKTLLSDSVGATDNNVASQSEMSTSDCVDTESVHSVEGSETSEDNNINTENNNNHHHHHHHHHHNTNNKKDTIINSSSNDDNTNNKNTTITDTNNTTDNTTDNTTENTIDNTNDNTNVNTNDTFKRGPQLSPYSFCTSCGARRHSNPDKFCHQCGSGLH